MHGAAQTAKAPPSSAAEPRRRAPASRPGASDPLRHRQQADEGEAEDDEQEARDLGLRGRDDGVADRGRAGPEHHEDDGEAEDERDARDDDPPCHASPLAEAADLHAETAER